jgi:hypothetical protein
MGQIRVEKENVLSSNSEIHISELDAKFIIKYVCFNGEVLQRREISKLSIVNR